MGHSKVLDPLQTRHSRLVKPPFIFRRVLLWTGLSMTAIFAIALVALNTDLIDLGANRMIYLVIILGALALATALSVAIESKRLTSALLIVGALLITSFAGNVLTLLDWTRGPLPNHSGTIQVAGLQDSVDIIRDEWGVAHIYASNTDDLFFAQGYTQAQDRWWQMELARHIGAGRIGELTGMNEGVLSKDLFSRTVGWYRAAEQDLSVAYDQDVIEILQAFSDGVNAYITSRSAGDLAFEYNLLGENGVDIHVEPWQPADSIVWAKVMAWQLSRNRKIELELCDLIGLVGEEMASTYYPKVPTDKPTILSAEDVNALSPFQSASVPNPDRFGDTSRCAQRQLVNPSQTVMDFGFGHGEGIGSNNWTVSGDLTSSDLPLLANDPHLGLVIPSVWYEIGLHCQPMSDQCPLNVVGFTFAPGPGVMLGHNEYIAWGATNAGPDVQDLYRIEANPDNPCQYRWDGEWRNMDCRTEIVRFGDGDEPITIQVRETHLGPIINDNRIDGETHELTGFNTEDPMALRWTAFDPNQVLKAFIELDKATNWAEFRDALTYFTVPSQNFVYADIEGNIGYQMSGRVPYRTQGHTGLLPIDGTSSKYEWRGFVPTDILPRALNPERGYIASANQALVPDEYYAVLKAEIGDENVYGMYGYDYGYRGQRINDLIRNSDSHNVATMQAMQRDNYNIGTAELLPALANLNFGNATLSAARDWLMQWNHEMTVDSSHAVLYAYFWRSLMQNLYGDELGDDIEVAGTTQQLWSVHLLLDDPQNAWWDDRRTPTRETHDVILARAFTEGYQAAVAAHGPDRNNWEWGAIHEVTFISNPLGESGIGFIENMVNRGPVAGGGGISTVNRATWSTSEDDFNLSGSSTSFRMIIDLSDFSNSRVINSTGQSGHPFTSNYADMINLWAATDYHMMLWERTAIENSAKNTLTLQPEQ